MKNVLILAGLLALAIGVGCKKEVPREDTTYKCECGSLTWRGQEAPLVQAEFLPLDTNQFSRKYWLSADIRQEDSEFDSHFLNVQFEVPDALDGVFAIDLSANFITQADEVTIYEGIDQVESYAAKRGIIRITPSVFGEEETGSLDLWMYKLGNDPLTSDSVQLVCDFKALPN